MNPLNRIFSRILLNLTAVITAGIAAACIATPQGIAEEPIFVRRVEGISEYRLNNGLQVLLFPDASSPKVTVNLTVFVGSRHEGYGEAGMAHLLEHMLFKGTPTHTNIPAALQERGAEFNGTTWLDRTNYYETMPAGDDNLEFAIGLEADRLVNSLIRAEDLASEMTVVRNEFERGENSPQRILMQRVIAAAFEWHNYGRSTIGNRADIERVPVENLRRFYNRFYQPDNAMLVIAGKFDQQRALELVQSRFGVLPRPERELDRTYTEEPAQDGERLVTLRRVGDVPLAAAVYHIPAGAHPDFAAVTVLLGVLTGEPSGRVYEALVKRRIAAGVYGMTFALHDPGMLLMMTEAAQGIDGTTLVQALLESSEGAAENPFTEEEVDRSRSELLRERELQFANSQEVAIELSDWAAQGDWRLCFLHRDRLEAVTPEDVTRVARQYLIRSNRTAGIFEPTKDPERATVPPTPDLADMIGDYEGREEIAQGEEFDTTPPEIEKRLRRLEITPGIRGSLLPKKTRGAIVSLRINLRYGNAEALSGKATAARLLPDMLNRGSQNMTRQQISDELNRLRAQLNVSGRPGILTVSAQTSRDSLPSVLQIVEEILRRPLFPDEELELIREEQLAGIAQRATDPMSLAMTRISRTISPFPEDDPRYVPTQAEDAARVQSVTTEQIRQVYNDLVSASTGEVTIIGDFDDEATVKAIRSILKDWKSDVPFERLSRTSLDNTVGDQQQIVTPDKANAVFVAAFTLPMQDSHPDYPALAIGNHILGSSGLASRLGDRVRQRDGLSYGVQSSLPPSAVDERTTFSLFAISSPDNTVKVQAAILEELDRLLKDGITQEELTAAVAGYLKEQEVFRSDDRALAQLLESYAFIGRKMDFVTEFEDKMSRLTVEDVNSALRKHLNPKRLFIITAGDFRNIGSADDQEDSKK